MIKKHLITLLTITTIFSSFPLTVYGAQDESPAKDEMMEEIETSETNDEIPVYCEDFIQWVIEDNFIAGRPTLENVGVEFTEDVAPFENMKLSLLNASHTQGIEKWMRQCVILVLSYYYATLWILI